MITCRENYRFDPRRIDEFTDFASIWMPLVEKLGGRHHGFFLAQSNAELAFALSTFADQSSLEKFREESINDRECHVAIEFARSIGCIFFESELFTPVL